MADLGYARVSTRIQDTLAQEARLTSHGCVRIFEEKASGYRSDRPALAELLDYAREGDRIVVVRLDRLGRSVPHLITVVAEMEKRGIQLLSLSESIDTTTAQGRLVFTIMAALAQFEGDLRRERQEEAWANGKQKGRPAVLGDERLAVARVMRAEGKSLGVIADTLGVGKTTIHRALSKGA